MTDNSNETDLIISHLDFIRDDIAALRLSVDGKIKTLETDITALKKAQTEQETTLKNVGWFLRGLAAVVTIIVGIKLDFIHMIAKLFS